MPTPRPPARWHNVWRNADVLIEGGAALTVASLAIRWLPFTRVLRLADVKGPASQSGSLATMRRARWAVGRLADLAPWRAVCFQRGLALHWMLRRRGLPSLLHYGVGRDGDRVTAHVWVSLDGQILIGGEEAARHPCLAIRPVDATVA